MNWPIVQIDAGLLMQESFTEARVGQCMQRFIDSRHTANWGWDNVLLGKYLKEGHKLGARMSPLKV